MISGRVSEELDPLVTIEIGMVQGNFQPVEVVVDTGFSGELALPADLIQSLGLEYIGDRPPSEMGWRLRRSGVLAWRTNGSNCF